MKQTSLYSSVVLGLGITVGIASSLSDSVAYKPEGLMPAEAFLQFFCGVINSFVVWFGVPLMLGYALSRFRGQALLLGGGFMMVAILAYFTHSYFNPANINSGAAPPVSIVLLWLSIAIAGGMAGGITGFFAQSKPVLLLLVLAVTALELLRRGSFSWQSYISSAENSVFILASIACVIYVARVKRKQKDAL